MALGSSAAFCIAALFILGWAITGPYFGFSPGWQMVINTGTTIGTFLMVFVIDNSQNRDGLALQIKLDDIYPVGSRLPIIAISIWKTGRRKNLMR